MIIELADKELCKAIDKLHSGQTINKYRHQWIEETVLDVQTKCANRRIQAVCKAILRELATKQVEE